MANPLEEILPLMAETCRFFELGMRNVVTGMSLVHKSMLSKFKTNYYKRVNNPEQTAKDLIQVLIQCESTEVNLLISPDNKLVKRLVELKMRFDRSFERLLF